MDQNFELDVQDVIKRYNTVIGEQAGRIILLETQLKALSEQSNAHSCGETHTDTPAPVKAKAANNGQQEDYDNRNNHY